MSDKFYEYLQELDVTQLQQHLEVIQGTLKERKATVKEKKWKAVVNAMADYCKLFNGIYLENDMEDDRPEDIGIDLRFCSFDNCGTIVFHDL